MRRARRASCSTRSSSPTSTSATCRSTSRPGQHTVYWGDSLLLGGAVHGVSYAQNSLDVWKGFCDAGHRGEGTVPPARRPHHPGAADEGAVDRRAVVLQLAGGPRRRSRAATSRSTTRSSSAATRRSSGRTRSPPRFRARRPSCALWNAQAVTEPSRYSGSLGDCGLSARWSPDWLDGTLGFYCRNATDILPQLMVTPGVVPGVPAATCTTIGGTPLRRRPASSTPTPPTSRI